MKKLHFDDLTKIDRPFGMLDEDTQKRLKNCGRVQRFTGSEWVETTFALHPQRTYRQKPVPKTVTVYIYEYNDTIFADLARSHRYPLIATGEIAIEEDEE